MVAFVSVLVSSKGRISPAWSARHCHARHDDRWNRTALATLWKVFLAMMKSWYLCEMTRPGGQARRFEVADDDGLSLTVPTALWKVAF